MLFNPLDEPLARTIRLPLYYTGLADEARVRIGDGPERRHALDRECGLTLELVLPPGMTWVEIR